MLLLARASPIVRAARVRRTANGALLHKLAPKSHSVSEGEGDEKLTLTTCFLGIAYRCFG